MTEQQIEAKKSRAKKEKQTQKSLEKQQEKQKQFQPPKEQNRSDRKEPTVDIEQSVKNIKQRGLKRKTSESSDLGDYVATPPTKKPKM